MQKISVPSKCYKPKIHKVWINLKIQPNFCINNDYLTQERHRRKNRVHVPQYPII